MRYKVVTVSECAKLILDFLMKEWKRYIINVRQPNSKVIKITTRMIEKEIRKRTGISISGGVIGSSLRVLESLGYIKIISRHSYFSSRAGSRTRYIVEVRW